MEKESEKEQIYVYVQLNHLAVHLKLTQHCKSTLLQYKIEIKKKESHWKVPALSSYSSPLFITVISKPGG